jgi:hypothetical protein
MNLIKVFDPKSLAKCHSNDLQNQQLSNNSSKHFPLKYFQT